MPIGNEVTRRVIIARTELIEPKMAMVGYWVAKAIAMLVIPEAMASQIVFDSYHCLAGAGAGAADNGAALGVVVVFASITTLQAL